MARRFEFSDLLDTRAKRETWETLLREKSPQPLSEEETRMLLRAMRRVEVKDGQVLFEEGERDDNVILVLKGQVDTYLVEPKPVWVEMGAFGRVEMEDGIQRSRSPLRSFCEGDCLGEQDFCHDPAHRCNAICVGDGEVLMLKASDLKPIIKDNPQAGCHLLNTLQGMLS